MSLDLIELRGEIDADHIAVIDAVVQATPGASRVSVVRQIISEWVARKSHEATLIQRVMRGKGIDTAPERKA